jgi:hypothetical protein
MDAATYTRQRSDSFHPDKNSQAEAGCLLCLAKAKSSEA